MWQGSFLELQDYNNFGRYSQLLCGPSSCCTAMCWDLEDLLSPVHSAALLRPYLMGFPQCCLISSAVGPCCTTVSKSTMGGQTTRQRWATGPARRRASFEEGCFMPAGRPVTAEQPWGLGHWLLSLRLRVWWELGVCERHEGPGVWPGQADFTINL